MKTLILSLLCCLALTGCGFKPLYAKKNAEEGDSKLFAGVLIDPIAGGRIGQQLKTDLEDRLNPNGVVPPHPAYRLAATLASTSSPIGVARDGTVSRYNVYLTSSFVLYRTSDGKQISSGKLSQVSSYNNVTNAYFSTYVADNDSVTRGIEELSEMYRQRLGAYLDAGAVPQKNVPAAPDQPAATSLPNNPWQGPFQSSTGLKAPF